MELKLEGKIEKIGQEEKFDKLTKKSMLLTTNDKYPQTVQLDFINDKVKELLKFNVGDNVSVDFNVRSNEYKGKYYTNLQGWKIAQLLGEVSNLQQNPSRQPSDTADFIF
jgi:single-strand DNA-binding protein